MFSSSVAKSYFFGKKMCRKKKLWCFFVNFICISYGPTEVTVCCTICDITFAEEILIGKVFHCLEYQIVDPKTLEKVAEGEKGELIVSGNN